MILPAPPSPTPDPDLSAVTAHIRRRAATDPEYRKRLVRAVAEIVAERAVKLYRDEEARRHA